MKNTPNSGPKGVSMSFAESFHVKVTLVSVFPDK